LVKVHTEKIYYKQNGKAIVGYYIDDVLKNNLENYIIKAVKQNFDGILAISGTEGCLAGNEKIYHNNKIKELQNIKDNSLFITKSFDTKKNKVINTIAQKVYTGRKKIYLLELENGIRIKCTEDHRFFIKSKKGIKEKRLKNLTTNDKILWIKPRTN
jgi:intein/homing endonuclease